jgi:DNA primase
MIPDDVIAQIRDKADIVAVIGQHVQLKKAGRNYKGLCPFHGEKTPSFSVSPDKGFFHCFGCQKKGDVFTFVMELEGKSFVEAAEQLGARFGIELPRIEESPELRRARGERVGMLEINKLATQFFRDMLADEKRGAAARAYLAKRGVGDAITTKFQLGYAPPEWSALADHLVSKRVDLELAVKLGLIAHRPRSGGFYDRFRDRLVCPVIVPGGDVVGFSARLIAASGGAGDADAPKYINSPESAVYKKSRLLFGLAQAREAMAASKRCVLVEGNFDVITLHQAGFTDVVAPLGTALTPEQVGQLKRLTDKIVLLYDGDKAGYKATMHALELCIEAEVEVGVTARPGNARSGSKGSSGSGGGPAGLDPNGGLDPDSLVAGGGSAQLREAIDRAIGGIEFFCYEVWGKARANADARTRALNDAARIVARVADPTKRNLIVGTLASALEITTDLAWGAMGRAQRPAGHPTPVAGPSRHPNAPTNPESSTTPVQTPPLTDEVELIAFLTDHPSLIASAEADKAFWLLTDARLRAMYSAAREGQSFLELASSLPSQTAEHVLSGKYVEAKNPRALLAEMAENLTKRREATQKATLSKSLAEAQRSGDRNLQRRLAQLAEAERKGDREAVARLSEEVSDEISRKQVH